MRGQTCTRVHVDNKCVKRSSDHIKSLDSKTAAQLREDETDARFGETCVVDEGPNVQRVRTSSMVGFVAATQLTLRKRSLFSGCAFRRPLLCHGIRPRRCCVSMSDRSTEFSLGDDRSSESSSDDGAPYVSGDQPFDWDAWRQSNESQTIPAIPFPPAQVFMPGERKVLHLFEARYLALFENVVVCYNKRCAHVLVATERNALAAYGTIVSIKSWRRLDVGVRVEFEGVARFRLTKLRASSPFLTGDFAAVEDKEMLPDAFDEAKALETRFWQAAREVISISIKLGEDPVRSKVDTASATIESVEPDGPRQQDSSVVDTAGKDEIFELSRQAKLEVFISKLKQAACRAADRESLDFFSNDVDKETLALRLRGLSFAGFDFFKSTPGERQKAIEGSDTLVRLRFAVNGLENERMKLAAKAALRDAFSN